MLKAGGGQPSSARAAQRFRQTLVTGQVALSMTLLALLTTESFKELGSENTLVEEQLRGAAPAAASAELPARQTREPLAFRLGRWVRRRRSRQ